MEAEGQHPSPLQTNIREVRIRMPMREDCKVYVHRQSSILGAHERRYRGGGARKAIDSVDSTNPSNKTPRFRRVGEEHVIAK